MVAKMFKVHLTENKCTNLHHPLKMFWMWNYMEVDDSLSNPRNILPSVAFDG